MATQTEKKEALNRLVYMEGHLKGIRKMVEEDHYCVDIFKQSHAVKRALDKFHALLVKDHLAGCVPQGCADERSEQVLAELNKVFALSRR
jgi:CsoR family transcriptional regulator, copper-sensing transcriptional repressor